MDLRQLSNFVQIAELQSLSRAAAMLGIAQPALSRQVKALEEELGVSLLTRHGWGVTPTLAGRTLADHARRVLHEAQAARDAVQALQAEPSGSVSLGVPTSLAHVLLPALAIRFRRIYPKLRLHLVEGFSASIHEWVLNGRLDVAVLYEQREMTSLISTPLLNEEMVLVGEAGRFHPDRHMPVPQLATLPLILPSRPHRLRLLLDDLRLAWNAPADVVMEVDALSILMELVRRGEGVTVLPYSCVAEEISAGRLSYTELEAAELTRTLLMVRPAQRTPTPGSEAVEREVRQFITEQAADLRWKPLFS